VNNKLGRIWGKTVVAMLKYNNEIYPDRGKRAPVKRLDVPTSIRTRQLTDARQCATAVFNSLGLPPY
jgi:hypothetical protein